MTPKKLNVMFAFFCYTGNSTGTSVVWPIASWWAQTVARIKTEKKFIERVGDFWEYELSDTPITMTRNRAVSIARKKGADILVMIDSDQHPDLDLGTDPMAERFFDVAFDAIYEHYDRGPLVVGAPYGGTPPHENMFVFTWSAKMNAGEESPFELRQYTREEAQQMAGLQECAALPTGLIAYDIRAFDLIDEPYFQYEWMSDAQDEKASTEDVQNTRDISLGGITRLGYNPLRCAWSSWAGHYKVWCVGKPKKCTADSVAKNLAAAVRRQTNSTDRIVDLDSFKIPDGMEVMTIESPPLGKVQECSPIHIPSDILDMIPDHERCNLKTRKVLGHSTVSFLHMTEIAHLEFLAEVLAEENDFRGRLLRVAEVGSWLGDSALAMAAYCEELHCVDNWEGSDADWTNTLRERVGGGETVRKLFEWNTRNVNCIVTHSGDSVEIAANGAPYELDVVFIDGDHSYESTKSDIEAWLPHLRPGGLMIGHDYDTKQFRGVDQAVHQVLGEENVRKEGSTEGGAFWLFREAYEDKCHA